MENEVKPGYKTTEFWVTVITSVATALNQSGVLGSFSLPTEALATIAGIVASYVLSRGVAKLTAKK